MRCQGAGPRLRARVHDEGALYGIYPASAAAQRSIASSAARAAATYTAAKENWLWLGYALAAIVAERRRPGSPPAGPARASLPVPSFPSRATADVRTGDGFDSQETAITSSKPRQSVVRARALRPRTPLWVLGWPLLELLVSFRQLEKAGACSTASPPRVAQMMSGSRAKSDRRAAPRNLGDAGREAFFATPSRKSSGSNVPGIGLVVPVRAGLVQQPRIGRMPICCNS